MTQVDRAQSSLVLRGRHGHARVAVLTIIDEEFDAAQTALGAMNEVGVTGVFSPISGSKATHPFVLAQSSDRSNTPASNTLSQLVEYFRPEVFLVVGIAGGIQRSKQGPANRTLWDGPRPGDVVVANYIHYGEFTKNLDRQQYARYFALDHPSSHLISAHARTIERNGGSSWCKEIKARRPTAGVPIVRVGELIAIECIAGDPKSEKEIHLLRRFDNAIAVDMESMGIARALHELRNSVHYNPTWMCIRGISDRVREKSTEASRTTLERGNNAERAQWKKYAAAAASTFAKRTLERLLCCKRLPVPADPGAPAWTFRSNNPPSRLSDPSGTMKA